MLSEPEWNKKERPAYIEMNELQKQEVSQIVEDKFTGFE